MNKSFKRIISIIMIMACISTCLFEVKEDTYANGVFASKYKQMVFNQENGLGSVEVNCIYQTASGYIWVGTDGGLYRYNGNEFKVFNLWDTEKSDVYCINALFQDDQGRLWIATDNYGLFYIKGSSIQHFSSDYYEGIKCINDVCQGADGKIYVATSYGFYYVNEEEMLLKQNAALQNKNIQSIVSFKDAIWGICDGNTIFCVGQDETVLTRDSSRYTVEELSCIEVVGDKKIYIGTIGKDVIKLSGFDDYKILYSGKEGINKIHDSKDNKIFVCTDNGIGYFDSHDTCVSIDDVEIDNYISDMIVDYEGNYWFSSSRMGILLLGFSKFSDYNQEFNIEESVTNCILQYRGTKYIGTDNGLILTDVNNSVIENDMTEQLKGTSIRHIMVDSKGNIWISTFRKYGVVKYAPDGTITNFGRSSKLLTNLVNCTYELLNGDIAVATEEGISIISTDDKIVKNLSGEVFEYSNIIALYEDDKGRIFAGSDGGGLYIIDGDTVTNFTESDGLTSNVVTCIVPGEKGVWLGTDNGLSLYNETIRSISNVDFSNNIFSMICKKDEMWIIGSKGVLKTNEDELVGNSEIKERYWAQNDGLDKTITINSKSYMDGLGMLYICCNQGIETLDTKNIPVNLSIPKVTVSEVDLDGETFSFDQIGGSLVVDSNVTRITISFGVLSFSNRENIQIQYSLEGFDKEPIIINGNDSMQAVYTNLEGGTYTFTLSAVNGDGVSSSAPVSFVIEKKSGLFEMRTVRIFIIVVGALILFMVLLVVIRFKKQVTGKNKEIEELSKEHEVALKSSNAKTDYLANMSNEIKTPINAIIRLAESMIGSAAGNSEQIDNIHSIIESGNDVIEKVDGIITLAKLESGRVEAVNAPYSITTLVCDVSDKVINQIGDRSIKFFVEIGENISDILVGDFDKIKDILELILDNAQKFTKEGSVTLSVDCFEYNDNKKNEQLVNLVFSIADTGIGIRPDRIEHIFEVYNITDNKKNSGYTGNGVGLAIAKKLSDIMDGDLEVDSTYGAGSTFTLSLLQKKPEKNIYQVPVNVDSIQMVSKEEAERMWTPDINALLVDDLEVSRKVAGSVMNQMEMKVDVATSGVSAIDMIMNNSYDIVFMDLSMPVMNGTDAMKEIRELEETKYHELPIIAMTEDAVGEDRSKVIESGFTDVLLKPMDIRNLATMINSHVSQSKIKHKTNNMIQYIKESRYTEGLEELQGYLEVVKTLEKIGGSIEVYNKIITTFYNQNINASEELKEKFESDYRGFRNRIHNIKNGSINIGSVKLASVATKIEAAINIGNKDYIRDNLGKLLGILTELLNELAKYLEFAEEQQGMTDEEYAAKVLREKQEMLEEIQQERENEEALAKTIIDENILRQMLISISDRNLERTIIYFDEICDYQYGAEDMDFINVLGDSIKNEDYDTMNELVTTYINLKYR